MVDTLQHIECRLSNRLSGMAKVDEAEPHDLGECKTMFLARANYIRDDLEEAAITGIRIL